MKTLAKWSVEDYHRLIETGILAHRRVELLKGEIVEMSPESPLHYTLASNGADYLRNLLKDRAHVRFNGPITLSNSEPEPDMAIVQLPRQRYQDHHPIPKEIFWLIEVSQSTLNYDLEEKKQAYAEAGISEYWVINLKATSITVFRWPEGLEYLSKREINQGVIAPLAFPNIEVSVETLLQKEWD